MEFIIFGYCGIDDFLSQLYTSVRSDINLKSRVLMLMAFFSSLNVLPSLSFSVTSFAQ